MSSQGSPSDSSRKRKSPFESPTAPGLTNKRRRNSALSLSKEGVEQHSQQSNDSSMIIDDSDAKSLASGSAATIEMKKENPGKDYSSIAKKFQITLESVKKYFDVFDRHPTVILHRLIWPDGVLSNSEIEALVSKCPPCSPDTKSQGQKKKGSKKYKRDKQGKRDKRDKQEKRDKREKRDRREKREHDSSSYSENYFTANSGFDHNESSEYTEPPRNKQLSKRTKENVEYYLQTLNGNSDVSHGGSSNNKLDLSKSSENAAYDSDNEFQIPRGKSSRSDAENKKGGEIVRNPFSKNEQARTSSQLSEKSGSYWKEKFGDLPPSEKKKKFINDFLKVKENISDTENDDEQNVDGIGRQLKTELKKNNSKKIKRKRIIDLDDSFDSDTDIQSSLVVQPPFYSMPSTSTDMKDETLTSFGKGAREKDKNKELMDIEEAMDLGEECNLSYEDKLIDVCAESSESIERIEEEPSAASTSLANEVEETSSDQSGDLFDSPTKSCSPSDRLVIDLDGPKSNAKCQSEIFISSPSSSDSFIPKGKPRIKSVTKANVTLARFSPRQKIQKESSIKSPSSPGANLNEVDIPSINGDAEQIDLDGHSDARVQKSSAVSLSSGPAKSNKVHTPSTDGDSKRLDSNEMSQPHTSNSGTPRTRGLKAAFRKVKCNLNNEESLKEYQNAKSKAMIAESESLEDICRDLTNLSDNEIMTLYKGGENSTDSNDKAAVQGDLSEDLEQTEDFASSIFANEKSNESDALEICLSPQFNFNKKVSSRTTTLKSSTSKTATPLSQSETSARITRSAVNSNATVTKALSSLPKIPRKDLRSNKSAVPTSSSSRDPRLNKPGSPATTRDPRLNRSLSPNKSVDVSATNVRVTRSASQKSPVLSPADPRLTRGQSRPRSSTPTPTLPTNISPTTGSRSADKVEEVQIVDPRLRKRKEREELEKAAKLNQEQEISIVSVKVTPQSKSPPLVSQFGQSSPAKEKKGGVFQRLGNKEPSPVRNELLNIIKSRRIPSPTKTSYETDDDCISANITDFFDSSDEDDKDSSPRHRKFELERNRDHVETASTSSAISQQTRAPQQRVPVKQRLSLNNKVGDASFQAPSNRRAPITAPVESSTVAPPTRISTTTAATASVDERLRNRQMRFGQPAAARPPVPQQNSTRLQPTNVNVVQPSSFMDSFYQMNAMQMMQDESNLMTDEQASKAYVTFGNGNDDEPNEFDHISILDNKPNISATKGLSDPRHTFFKDQCFRMLRFGNCNAKFPSKCNFQHQESALVRKIKAKTVEFIKAIVDTCIKLDFDYFLNIIWKQILPQIKTDAFDVYKKLYDSGKGGKNFVLELLNFCLSEGTHTLESFLKEIAPFIADNDSNTVQAICAAIKGKISDGFCWETIKDICKKAAPPVDMVEVVLLQCLKRKKNRNHILEVNEMIKTKMLAQERNKLSGNLLKQFSELVQRNNPPQNDNEIKTTMPLNNVTNNLINGPSFQRQSVNIQKTVAVQPVTTPQSTKPAAKINNIYTPRSPDSTSIGSPYGNQSQIPPIVESEKLTQYTPKLVDSSEPKSIFKDRFWKLYAALEIIEKGLKHGDYDFVYEQLDKFITDNIEKLVLKETGWEIPFKKACYHILCKNVKACERHLSEIIKRAAKNSSSRFTSLLFEIGMYALRDLGNSNLWGMALQLLNRLKVFETDTLPTAYILISAEIYLANDDPAEALYLLQRTKLIRTNRDEWLVKDSEKADEEHRNRVVFILLQALAHVDPEKAFYLFKELIADQYIYYFPIDLSSYLDKFVLLLLIHKRLDLAAEVAVLTMSNDMTFKKPTYQELLTHLLPVDEVLVNQILEYAVNLGYYNDIRIRQGFTTLIIDMNYTEEEVYLVLKRLVHKLTINLGPTISRLKSNHLKVTLVLEDVPTGKRLYKDDTVTKINFNKNKQMRRTISHILATRFSPAIRLSQGRADRFCKIISTTLVDHLKHWH